MIVLSIFVTRFTIEEMDKGICQPAYGFRTSLKMSSNRRKRLAHIIMIEEFRNAIGHLNSIMMDTDLIGIDNYKKLDSDYPYHTWLAIPMIWRI